MTYYDILEVSPKASKEVIEKAYRVLAKKYHPDVNPPEARAQCEEHMKAINVAYETLTDDEKRKQYDLELNVSGYSENEQPLDENTYEKEFAEMLKPRPWARYFARSIDIFLGGIVVATAWTYLHVSSYNAITENISGYITGTFLYGIWLFVESFVTSITATTPGKWIFNLYVLDKYGNKLDYKTSLKRNFLVFYRGLGLGIPIISLYTMIKAYGILTTMFLTSWDIDCGTVSISKKGSIPKTVISVLMIIALFTGIAYLELYQVKIEKQQQAFAQQMNDMYTRIENEDKALTDMRRELDSDYQEFMEFEEQMKIWLESDTDKYDENFSVYEQMIEDYNNKLEEFERRREKYNQLIEDYNKKLGTQEAKQL